MPVLKSDENIQKDPVVAARRLVERIKTRKIHFQWFRYIIKTPTWYIELMNEIMKLDPNIELLDMPSFFKLYRLWLYEKHNVASGLIRY